MPQHPHTTFSVRGTEFLLNGRPFQIRSGEMHYFRIPREYWRDRLLKLRAMGRLNVPGRAFDVSIYTIHAFTSGASGGSVFRSWHA